MITANSLMYVVAAFELTDLLPAAGVLLIVMSLMTSLRKKKRKSAGQQRLTPREEGQRARDIRGLRGDMEELMVEVEQLARRMGTQLDAKTIELEMVIQEADQKIAELRQLQGAGQAEGHRNAAVAGSTEAAMPIEAKVPGDTPGAQEENTLDSEAAGADVDPVAQSVYQLADEGLEPPAIAAKLDEHVGKVELILALRAS